MKHFFGVLLLTFVVFFNSIELSSQVLDLNLPAPAEEEYSPAHNNNNNGVINHPSNNNLRNGNFANNPQAVHGEQGYHGDPSEIAPQHLEGIPVGSVIRNLQGYHVRLFPQYPHAYPVGSDGTVSQYAHAYPMGIYHQNLQSHQGGNAPQHLRNHPTGHVNAGNVRGINMFTNRREARMAENFERVNRERAHSRQQQNH